MTPAPPDSAVAGFKSAVAGGVAKTVETTLLADVRKGPIPKHIGIIMDGNRRFAKEMGEDATKGHEAGRDTLENVLDWCLDVGVRHLTVYAFSTENFRRSPREVKKLMDLFEENFVKMAEDERVHKNRIHVRAIGHLERLPRRVRRAIEYAEEKTRDYEDYYYTICVAYGGREEIVRAIRNIAEDVKAGRLRPQDVSEDLVSKYMWTSYLPVPDPDLVLRTSGEERISNFLLWQLAYSELYFTDVYWPGFRKVDFLRAIRTFQQRQRRYGE